MILEVLLENMGDLIPYCFLIGFCATVFLVLLVSALEAAIKVFRDVSK